MSRWRCKRSCWTWKHIFTTNVLAANFLFMLDKSGFIFWCPAAKLFMTIYYFFADTWSRNANLHHHIFLLLQRSGRIEEEIEMLQRKLKNIEEGIAFGGKRTKSARSQGRKIQITIEQERSRWFAFFSPIFGRWTFFDFATKMMQDIRELGLGLLAAT